MESQLMSVVVALGLAVLCMILVSFGLGVFLVAWGAVTAWGVPVALVVITAYLSWWPPPIPWPWRKPAT